MKLSPEQTKAFDAIMQWHKSDKQEFVLAGFAGTGKTTMAKYIAENIGRHKTAFCAYTGKAANMLREKGCEAKTIHGYLYSLISEDAADIEAMEKEIDRLLNIGNNAEAGTLSKELAEKRLKRRQPRYTLNYASELVNMSLVIVDEYSMLDDKLIEDLRKICKKILYIGDPFQLPPVKGECSLKPDMFITEIHRQAMDSAIIRYSKKIRDNEGFSFCKENDFAYQPKREVAPDVYTSADQIICGINKTRNDWNNRFRQLLGHAHNPLPRQGEKLICLRNNHAMDLYNGMIGTAKLDAYPARPDCYTLSFDKHAGLNVFRGDIEGRSSDFDFSNPVHKLLDRFDYAYCITAHKSQGSEFDNVVIYDQPIGKTDEDKRRWRYTSLTRSKKSCIMVAP